MPKYEYRQSTTTRYLEWLEQDFDNPADCDAILAFLRGEDYASPMSALRSLVRALGNRDSGNISALRRTALALADDFKRERDFVNNVREVFRACLSKFHVPACWVDIDGSHAEPDCTLDQIVLAAREDNWKPRSSEGGMNDAAR